MPSLPIPYTADFLGPISTRQIFQQRDWLAKLRTLLNSRVRLDQREKTRRVFFPCFKANFHRKAKIALSNLFGRVQIFALMFWSNCTKMG